jgi:hypothetical protein
MVPAALICVLTLSTGFFDGPCLTSANAQFQVNGKKYFVYCPPTYTPANPSGTVFVCNP